MIDKGRIYSEKESNKQIQDYNKNSIFSTKELIKRLLGNSLNNSLTKLESNNEKQNICFGLFHNKIKNFANTIPNVLQKVEEIIKKSKQTEKKEQFKKIDKKEIEYNTKSKFDKIKKNFKIKLKKLTKEDDIANKTVSNFKEVYKKSIFKEKNKEKDLHKFKRIPTNTLINFNKNNKTVQNSPKKKIEKEKIRGRNINISNINDNSYMTYRGYENKTIIKNNPKENKIEKKLISSKSFVLKSITNISKGDKKLTLNKAKIIDNKKGFRGKLFKNIKKKIKKTNKNTGKKGEKVNKTSKNSKDKDSKGIEKKEEKTNQEETIKETKMQTKEKKLSILSDELKYCKKNLPLIEKDNRNELFMQNQNKTVIITTNSISIIDEIILSAKGESLQNSYSYTYLMDYEVNKLKSKEIYIDGNKVDDTNFEIKKDEYCIIIPNKEMINNNRRKIKIIQEFKNEFSNYSLYDIYLRKEGVLTSFLIKGDDEIQIDDATNKNFKVYKSMNMAYFEGKTTKEIIANNGYLLYSKKYNYQIYKYIPEFRSKENDTIKLKESDYKIAINILARYKKVVITDYGLEIEDIYKIKLSNYPSNMQCCKISYPLEWNFKYEINLVELNGQKIDFRVIGDSINIFKFGAFNNQFGELHYKYKYYARNIYETYRTESIITKNIKNTYCKLIIEIPNNYAVLGTNDIYQKSKSNDYEYIYNGISNKEEINEFVKLSIKKGEWFIYNEITINSKENIEKSTIRLRKYFKGGNIEEESYEFLNENVKEVIDVRKGYIIKCNNLNTNKAIIKFKIKAKNSTIDYIFDGNEELITKVPEEDKQFFKDLSDKIIKEDNSDFPVYKKLGKKVRNYLTYNMFYSGKYLNAKQIYENRAGVCIHFTLLYNTLLVSQGIKAVEVVGYGLGCWEKEKEKFKSNNIIENNNFQPLNRGHMWTLALIDEKWVPLDATWTLFEKNVPLSHIFKYYNNSSVYSNNQNSQNIQKIFFDNTKLLIKYFGNK